MSPSRLPRCRGGARAREPAEDGAAHEACTRRVVVEEEAARELARGEEARHHAIRGVAHARRVVDLEAAVREGDAARHGVGDVGRRVDPLRPVGLRRLALGRRPQPVEVEGVELPLAARGVEALDGGDQRIRIDPELLRERRQVIGDDGRAGRVARLEQVHGLVVEELERPRALLRADGRAGLGVRHPHVHLALVDEALAVGVQQQRVGVAVAAHLVGEPQVADIGRARVERRCVAAAPVAGGLRARVHGRGEHGAHVEARAAHLHEIPAGAEPALAHLGVRLEPARGQHRDRVHLGDPGHPLDHDAAARGAVHEQLGDGRLVPDVDARGLDGAEEIVHEPDALAGGAQGTAGRQRVGLARRELLGVDELADAELPPDAVLRHPLHGLVGAVDDAPGQVGAVAALADAAVVLGVLRCRVGVDRDAVGPAR